MVQVSATFAVAYVGYYVAEAVCKTSGVISTVVTGIMTNFFGHAMMNCSSLFDDFWSLVEHLLNTVLFTLGGVVWGEYKSQGYCFSICFNLDHHTGAVIANGGQEKLFTGKDWGYLVLLYLVLSAIRAFSFTVAYPITSRIGLKSSVKETSFSVYAGLRGAVGLSLALFLDNEVQGHGGEAFREQTRKLFGYVSYRLENVVSMLDF